MAVPNRRSSSSSTSSSLKSPNTEMRRSILRKIRKTCFNNDEDPISGLTWQEMSNDQLRTLIRLGEGKKKYCYSMESLQGLLEHSRRHGIDIKNPTTRANLTAAEIIFLILSLLKYGESTRQLLEDTFLLYPLHKDAVFDGLCHPQLVVSVLVPLLHQSMYFLVHHPLRLVNGGNMHWPDLK